MILLKNRMQNQKAELMVLQVLKQCRAEMLEDFLNHKPDIYTPSYKYENSPVLLKLASEKYFMMWLSGHWHKFNQAINLFPAEERESIEKIFANVFLKLLEKYSNLKVVDSRQLSLSIKLIEDMQIALNEIIKFGDDADNKRNQLELTLEKNRVLFEREFKRLTEEKS